MELGRKMPWQQRTSHNLPLPPSTYTEVKRQDGGGDGDGDVLGEDGQPDHVVPGPHVHQPAQGVTEQQQGQTAHQTVDRHQLETERRSNTACYYCAGCAGALTCRPTGA